MQSIKSFVTVYLSWCDGEICSFWQAAEENFPFSYSGAISNCIGIVYVRSKNNTGPTCFSSSHQTRSVQVVFLRGATQKSSHKCCQLVLTNMIMVNTYTKITLNICPTLLHKFWYQNMKSFQSYDVMLHTMSSALPEKIDPQPGQNRFYIFARFRLDGAFTLRSRVNFAHCDFWLFFLDWRSRWHDGNLPGSGTSQKPKVISELNAIPALQVWLRQLEMCVASELRDVLWRIAKVWWRYVHWFPFYMTGDRTFGLALVRQTR